MKKKYIYYLLKMVILFFCLLITGGNAQGVFIQENKKKEFILDINKQSQLHKLSGIDLSFYTEEQLFTLVYEKLEAKDCKDAWNILWLMVGKRNYNAAYLLAIYAYLDVLNPPLPIVKDENGKFIDHFITMLFYAQMSDGKSLSQYSKYYYDLDNIIFKYAYSQSFIEYKKVLSCPTECNDFDKNNYYNNIGNCITDRSIKSIFGSGLPFILKKSCAGEFTSRYKIIDISSYYNLFNKSLERKENKKYLDAHCGSGKI